MWWNDFILGFCARVRRTIFMESLVLIIIHLIFKGFEYFNSNGFGNVYIKREAGHFPFEITLLNNSFQLFGLDPIKLKMQPKKEIERFEWETFNKQQQR